MYEKFLEEVEEFIFMENQPEQADIIFVPGNSYPYMAEKAAELYMAGMAPVILQVENTAYPLGNFLECLERKKNMMEIITQSGNSLEMF